MAEGGDLLSTIELIPIANTKPAGDDENARANNNCKRAKRITELECYKISNSFPLRSSDRCSIQNDFAVIIETGVHILSFRPNLWNNNQNKSQKYAIQRAFIQTPTKFPLDDLPLDYQKLDREKFCLLYLNPKLRPSVDRLDVPIRRVKQVDWGYITSPFQYRSILGVLTNQGCLQLYFGSRFRWTLFADISDLWKQYCLKTWFSNGDNDFESFMKAHKRIRITTFAWCNGVKVKNESDALLLGVSEDGMLSIWTISEDIGNKPPELIKTHELGPSIHTCLWYTMTNGEQAFLVSGFTDGTVALNVCTIDHDSGDITFKGDLTLWKEQDYAIAENMKIKVDKESAFLVLSKEQWLLIFNLDDEVTVQQFSFETRIAGLEIMNDFTIFVTLLNFKSFLVKPFKEEDKEPIPLSFPTNIKNHRCSGVSFSKNKEFCVFSVNLAKFHDHLTFKEPWYLLWCSVNDQLTLEDLQNAVIRSSVHEVFDCIENFRLFKLGVFLTTTAPYSYLIESASKIACSNLNRIHSLEKEFTIDENALLSAWNFMNEEDPNVWRKILQLMYILMSGSKLGKNPEDVYFVEMALSMYNFQYFNGTERSERSKTETDLYRLWLRANYNKLRESIKRHRLFENISIDPEKDETIECDVKCELCSSNFIVHHPTNYVVCEKEHKVLRCRYSFLPILSQPYSECSCCHAVMIRKAGLRRCVMCDSEL